MKRKYILPLVILAALAAVLFFGVRTRSKPAAIKLSQTSEDAVVYGANGWGESYSVSDYGILYAKNNIVRYYDLDADETYAPVSYTHLERIIGVETGGCPHTAIREDASMNLEAVDEMIGRFPDIELLFIESGGDNLSATFSPELVDATIFVIDVAEGDKIPRKGGPGITRSDLLVINKIDLAPYVGASLEVMERDSKKMRGRKPFVFTNIREQDGLDAVISWIKKDVLLKGM